MHFQSDFLSKGTMISAYNRFGFSSLGHYITFKICLKVRCSTFLNVERLCNICIITAHVISLVQSFFSQKIPSLIISED